jgi:hypothetical protein
MVFFHYVFVALVLRCLNIVQCSDASNFLSMQQQFQIISAGAAAHQPHRLETAPQTEQKASLLSIVKHIQSDHVGQQAKPKHISADTVESQVSLHEKRLVSNMGALEQQLEAWKKDEQQLQSQVASANVEMTDSGDTDLLSSQMWRNRNALKGLSLSVVISLCFFGIMLRPKKQPNREMTLKAMKDTLDAQAVLKEPVPSEVSRLLADLAVSIDQINMPSEGSLQIAMQAMKASECKELREVDGQSFAEEADATGIGKYAAVEVGSRLGHHPDELSEPSLDVNKMRLKMDARKDLVEGTCRSQ